VQVFWLADRVQQCGDDALVAVHGVVDPRCARLLPAWPASYRDHTSVVVDRRNAVLASPHGLQDLVVALQDRARAEHVVLVCDRAAGRRLLRLACGDAAGVRVLREVPGRAAAGGVGRSDQPAG
jgi:hypothetical protein